MTYYVNSWTNKLVVCCVGITTFQSSTVNNVCWSKSKDCIGNGLLLPVCCIVRRLILQYFIFASWLYPFLCKSLSTGLAYFFSFVDGLIMSQRSSTSIVHLCKSLGGCSILDGAARISSVRAIKQRAGHGASCRASSFFFSACLNSCSRLEFQNFLLHTRFHGCLHFFLNKSWTE